MSGEKRIDNLPPSEDEIPDGYEAEAGRQPVKEEDYPAVRVQHDNPSQAVFYTVVLTSQQPVQPLLPLDPERYHAEVIAIDNPVIISESESKAQAAGNAVSASPVGSYAASGSQADPPVNTVIASVTLPQGTYVVTWSILLNGTITGADQQNAALYQGSAQIVASICGTTANTVFAQQPVTVVVPAGGAVIAIQTTGAGSGTATYKAQISATPSDSVDIPQPQGQYLPAGQRIPVYHTSASWVSATTTAGTTRVSVMVEKK